MIAMLTGAAIVLAGASGLPGLFLSRASRAASRLATLALVLAALLAGAASVMVFAGAAPGAFRASWSMLDGELYLRLDALAAVFFVQAMVLSALGSIYALEYFAGARDARKVRLFYGLAVAGMATVVVAGNMVLLLFGWEVMALAAFFALSVGDEKEEVRQAGYLFLAATHAGSLCLFVMTALLHASTGGLDFGVASSIDGVALGHGIFALALVGFGLKAGIIPLHVWLPGAHAQAPTHVSALLSAVMLKIGVYGLVRIGSMLASPPLWCAYVCLGAGVLSAVLGVLFALGQHEMKRLLAYHSIENIGIIFMGLGVAMLGRSTGQSELVVLGLAGALLHVWNHGMFKALLFFAAGAVIRATGTQALDRQGGLVREMPRTAVAFLVGSTAICGLPPLCGFVSELCIYLGLARALLPPSPVHFLPPAIAIALLATVGALACACFAKAFGVVFLGVRREPTGEVARDPGSCMLVPMYVLGGGCVIIGVAPWLVAPALDSAVAAWMGDSYTGERLAELLPLWQISVAAAALMALLVLVAFWLRARLARAARVPTWDCGYARPSPSMQYTASSFADGIVKLARPVLRPRVVGVAKLGLWPKSASFHSEVQDLVLDRVLLPVALWVRRVCATLRRSQAGNVQLYLAYIAAAIILLALWMD